MNSHLKLNFEICNPPESQFLVVPVKSAKISISSGELTKKKVQII